MTVLLATLCFALGAKELTTTTVDQNQLHVTIYNSNIALVKDQRALTLPTGINTLAFKDVSASIKPETAILTADGVTLLEQNFEYDLLTPEALLNKFVGKNVTLERLENDQVIKEIATVLANNHGTVFKVGDKIRTSFSGASVVYDDVPADLRDRPTLTMLIDNNVAKKQSVALSYLTDNLSWKADYVASLVDDKHLDLQGWVTLNNRSGTTYNNAQLQLVAGELNRVQQANIPQRYEMAVMAKSAPVMGGMREESLFEYHLYSLERPTTIKNNQQKQVALLSVSGVPYQKKLTINADNAWASWGKDSEYHYLSAVATIAFDNDKAKQLGLPLPAGTVRTYQKDSQSNEQFIGEDHIEHTAENDTVSLTLGEAFDVRAKRKQTDFKRQRKVKQTAVGGVEKTVIETAYEVIFSNAKDVDVVVDYQEHFTGAWTIEKQSLPSDKLSSMINRWKVHVPAKGEVTLSYRVTMVY